MHRATIVTIALYSSLFMNFFLVASFDNLGPRLAELHEISFDDLSYIVSMKSFMNMVCGPAFALLSSKLPASLLFTIGGFCLCSAMLTLAFSSSFAEFIIGRMLHGFGTSGLMVGGMSILMRCVKKKERGRYTSIAYSSAGHAPLIAPVISGLMFDKLGQTWTFLIMAILTFSLTSTAYIVLKRVLRVPALDSLDSQIETIEPSQILSCVKRIFSNPMTVVAVLGIFSQGFSFGCTETVLPVALTEWDDNSLPVLTTSLIYSIGPLTFTIVAPIVGYLVDRIGHYKVLLTGISLYAILYPIFQFLTDSIFGLGACIAISFGICAVCEVSIYPFVAEIGESSEIPHADTVAYATNEMLIQGGYAVGNVVGRRLVDWNGMTAFGWFISGWDILAVFISCVVLISTRRRKEKLSPRADDEIVTN